MAITNNGTVVDMQASDLPVGYTKPTVTTFSDEEYKGNFEIKLDKATLDDPDPLVTMAAIVSGVTTAVNTILTNDWNAAATGEAFARITDINLNANVKNKQGSDFYNDASVSYLVATQLFVKTP